MLFHNTEILYLFQQFYFSVPQNSIDIFFRNQVILLPVLLLYAKTERILIMKFSQDLQETMKYLNNELHTDRNFDVVYRVLTIGGKNACLYFIDGFTKDDTLLKLLQALSSIQADRMPKDAHSFSKQYLPYGEIGLIHESSEMVLQLLSGVSCLFIDGYDACLTIDCRTYPARGVSEPEKDKVMRGSRDGFVETLVFNTALIRRRIRDPKLSIEIMTAGESSHTDIAICYMENRVDQKLLSTIKKRIRDLEVDALTMNQESLAECLSGSIHFPNSNFPSGPIPLQPLF